MKRATKTVNIIDVAKAAGVSVSTVSRVLNSRADVAFDTQERVLSVIGELGYTSSWAARSMRSHRKNLIGLVVPDIGWPYSIEVMKGINRAIAESPFDLLLYTAGDVRKAGAASHEQHYVSLYNSIADGVLIVASAAADFTTNAPVVSIDPHGVNPSYPFVQATNYEGAREAMRYLLELGHRRIAFVRLLQMQLREVDAPSRQRLTGYREAFQTAGLEAPSAWYFNATPYDKPESPSIQALFDAKPAFTAVVATDVPRALLVKRAAEARGLRIPRDLSLLCFQGIEPEIPEFSGPRVDFERLGREAVRLLSIPRRPRQRVQVPMTWAEGATIAPPRASHGVENSVRIHLAP